MLHARPGADVDNASGILALDTGAADEDVLIELVQILTALLNIKWTLCIAEIRDWPCYSYRHLVGLFSWPSLRMP